MSNKEHVKEILIFDKKYQIKVASEKEKQILTEASQYITEKWKNNKRNNDDIKKDYVIIEIVMELWQKVKECEEKEREITNVLQRINISLEEFLQNKE